MCKRSKFPAGTVDVVDEETLPHRANGFARLLCSSEKPASAIGLKAILVQESVFLLMIVRKVATP